MQQGRWVSYIFRYRNNARCENAGFIKVQKIANINSVDARIQIGIKIYKKNPCTCKAYLLWHDEQRVMTEYLTEIKFLPEERDTILKRVELPWSDPLGNGIAVEAYDGIFFMCDDGERLVGMWNEFEVMPDDIEPDKKAAEALPEAKEIPLIVKPEGKEPNELSMTVAREKNTADICKEILDTHQKLPLFADSQFIECVRIVPQDIGRLAMENWKLGVNSFLTHGYYHYRYLMLGRVNIDDAEHTVIGVPGIFSNKEKYLANMFGFRVFVPAKRTEFLTGKFGYWISEVAKV